MRCKELVRKIVLFCVGAAVTGVIGNWTWELAKPYVSLVETRMITKRMPPSIPDTIPSPQPVIEITLPDKQSIEFRLIALLATGIVLSTINLVYGSYCFGAKLSGPIIGFRLLALNYSFVMIWFSLYLDQPIWVRILTTIFSGMLLYMGFKPRLSSTEMT